MPVKQDPLSRVNLVTPGPSIATPDPTATLLKGAAGVVSDVRDSLATARKQEEAAASDVLSTAQEEVYSAMEDSLLNTSFAALSQQEGQQQVSEISDAGLSPSDKKAVQQARDAQVRLANMEAQEGLSARVKMEQAKVYRDFKARFPQLSSQLREVFKKQTGQTAVELLREVEEESSKSAAEERDALKGRLLATAKSLGFTPTSESIPELMSLVAPYEKDLTAAADAKRKATLLKDLKDIRTEERIALEEDIRDQGFNGLLIDQQSVVNGLLDGFDPKAANEEERRNLLAQLQMNKRAAAVNIKDVFRVTDVTFMTDAIDATYDEAMKVVTGELSLDVLKTGNTLKREMAVAGLYRTPGFADVQARLESFRNIPSELVAGDQRVAISKGMVQPMLEMLATGMRNPNKNPYAILEAKGTPQQVAGQYRALRDVALAELDNEEAAQNLADALQAWTNEFRQAPEEVPAPVLASMLEVFSDPRGLNVLEKSDALAQNLASGFLAYTDKLRVEMAQELAKEFKVNVPVFDPDKPSPVEAGFLGFLTKGYAESFRQPVAAPRLIELVDVTFNRNGSISFAPKAIQELQGNAQVARKAKNLTDTVGPIVGQLVRAYAHVVNGNKDYKAAAQQLIESDTWTTRLEKVGTTGFEGTPARQQVRNPDGSISTEKTITVIDDRLNGGKPTNIPSMFGGKVVSEEEAINAIVQAGGVDPETGRELPGYATIQQAVDAAVARSQELGRQLEGQQ